MSFFSLRVHAFFLNPDISDISNEMFRSRTTSTSQNVGSFLYEDL